MIARTQRRTVEFRRAFLLKGVDRILPAGKYDIVSDEELIEGLSFSVYRRVSTFMFVPSVSQVSAVEMVAVDPHDLQAAQDRDAGTPPPPITDAENIQPKSRPRRTRRLELPRSRPRRQPQQYRSCSPSVKTRSSMALWPALRDRAAVGVTDDVAAGLTQPDAVSLQGLGSL
jgi:hypothetical protein